VHLLLIQLSDIHIRTESDPVLSRVRRIIDAVRNLDYDLNACVVLLSGDVAYSGSEAEYLIAWGFVDQLKTELEAALQKKVHFVVVPGNHDCDLSGTPGLREVVLESVTKDPTKLAEASLLEVCTSVQTPFFSFADAISSSLALNSRAYFEYRFTLDGRTVLFRCYNTAILSKRQETSGVLRCPLPGSQQISADLVISVFHHPYPWLAADNAKALRRQVEGLSDIIFTGHEHDEYRRVQEVGTGETNEYIEGGVLQEPSDPDSSDFNILLLDLSKRRQQFHHFRWNGEIYAPDEASNGEWHAFQVNRLRAKREYELDESFAQFLDDPGLSLTHREKGPLRFADIFVYPDLRELSRLGEPLAMLRGDGVFERLRDLRSALVTGAEQSGKTALAKQLFVDFRSKGFVPVYIDASQWRIRSVDRTYDELYSAFALQYGQHSLEKYRQLDPAQRVIIIDNLHKLTAGRSAKKQLVPALAKFAGHTILLAHDLALQVEEMASAKAVSVSRFRIQQFGHLLRNRLVEKWFLLSNDPAGSEEELAAALDRIERTLDTILGKNFVPSFPVFILAILQAGEASTPIDLRAGTHGYFYELLIRSSLVSEEDRSNYDITSSFLAFLAHHLFMNRSRDLSFVEMVDIHRDFEAVFHVSRPVKEFTEMLVARQMLTEKAGRYSFKYKYGYYYFVASYIRDRLSEQAIRDKVSALAERLYVEENANILLFLAHLSKDPFIIQQMLRHAESVYPGTAPATLADDAKFLNELMSAGIGVEYVEKDPRLARKEALERLDSKGSPDGDREDTPEASESLDPATAMLDPIIRLNVALKAQQILGQILKNFPGTLEGSIKMMITRQCYALGLRALAAVFGLIRNNQLSLLEEVRETIREEHPTLDAEEIIRHAKQAVIGMALLIAYGLLKRASFAVGSPDLEETYARVLKEGPTTAVELIDASIKLDHFVALPEQELFSLGEDLRTNPFALSLLHALVVNRLYMFPADFRVKQRVCARLGIPFKPAALADPSRKVVAAPEISIS
jgi:hypothetical protein